MLCPGARATIHGLRGRAECNGAEVVVLEYLESAGRWGVRRVDDPSCTLSVKSENLCEVKVDEDEAAIAWLRAHPKCIAPLSEAVQSIATAAHRPAWLDDIGLQESLMDHSKLVRISSALPEAFAAEVAANLDELPEQLWAHHHGARAGFQFSHHNVYLSDHRELIAHAPAYHAACAWLQSQGCAWFERVTGLRGEVTVSASWYRPGDHSTPHNDLGRRRVIAFVWHLIVAPHTWDERCGGDLVWCEPYSRHPPCHNALYLFRVHDASHHFVQRVTNPHLPAGVEGSCSRSTKEWSGGEEGNGGGEEVDGGGEPSELLPHKRLAVNGWFTLLPSEATAGGDDGTVSALEARMSDEGQQRHRRVLAKFFSCEDKGEEAAFVHHCDGGGGGGGGGGH